MKPNRLLTITLAASLLGGVASAESLFRGGVAYTDRVAFTPHSLYTQPRPQHVGDIITVTIDQTTEVTSQGQLKIARNQDITENGTSMVNQLLHNVGLPKKWGFPNFSGLNNDNNLNSVAQVTQTNELTDSITCQVVQILPNGYLVIQGRKTIAIAKERQDMMLTGIVNPFYLDRTNTIASNMVANLQVINGGHGVISRQQNDGIANKFYQYFN